MQQMTFTRPDAPDLKPVELLHRHHDGFVSFHRKVDGKFEDLFSILARQLDGIFPQLSQGVLATQSRPGSGWGQSSEQEQARRSVYIYIKRTLTVPLMDSFDQPTPDQPAPARATTTIAPQALILLNSTFMDNNAAAFAERVVREAGDERPKQVDRAFRLALLRPPAEQERQLALEFLDRQKAEFQSVGKNDVAASERHALTAMCRMLFNLNEFMYVD